MITWIQRVLTRHYKWMFVLLILCVALPFIFNVGASPGLTSGKEKSGRQMFFGINLNDPDQAQELLRDAAASHYMNTGQPMVSEQQAQSLSLSRPALLKLAEDLQIPGPSDQELVAYIKTKNAFKDEEGNFSPEAYDNFLEQINADPEASEDHIRDVLSQDYKMDAVVHAIGGQAYVNPYEAILSVSRARTKWSIQVATLDYDDVEKSIVLSDEALNKFYEEHKANYMTAPKVKASYVVFENKKFDGNVAKAGDAASDFLFKIYDNDIKYKSETFKSLLSGNNLKLKELPAYTRTSYLEKSDLPVKLLDQAFALNADHYYSDMVEIKDGVAILFYDNVVPAGQLSFDDVKTRVSDDYRSSQREKMVQVRGVTLKEGIEKAMKDGKSFEKSAHGEHLVVDTYKDFELSNPPAAIAQNIVLLRLLSMEEGQLSELIKTDQMAYLVYVNKKIVPEVTADDKEVLALEQNLKLMAPRARAQSFINALIARELKKNL